MRGLDGARPRMHIHPMTEIKAICVYCGSGPGNNPAYLAAARQFGRALAESKVRLVYGGGSIGLMGALAESALGHGAEVPAIIPDFPPPRQKQLPEAQRL